MSEEKKNKHFGAAIIDEVKEMVLMGKTQKEIAEHFGLKDKFVVKQLLKRERAKERRILETRIPQPKGRPRTNILFLQCVIFFMYLVVDIMTLLNEWTRPVNMMTW